MMPPLVPFKKAFSPHLFVLFGFFFLETILAFSSFLVGFFRCAALVTGLPFPSLTRITDIRHHAFVFLDSPPSFAGRFSPLLWSPFLILHRHSFLPSPSARTSTDATPLPRGSFTSTLFFHFLFALRGPFFFSVPPLLIAHLFCHTAFSPFQLIA